MKTSLQHPLHATDVALKKASNVTSHNESKYYDIKVEREIPIQNFQ